MRSPDIKHVNTISLKFIKGERNNKACKRVLIDLLCLKKGDIYGFGTEGKFSVRVKFSNEEIYNDIVSTYNAQIFNLSENTSVQLLDISTYKIKVSIKNVPFEVPNTVLWNILQKHGKVESINFCYNQGHEDEDWLEGTLSMERYALMKEITQAIPSTYFLNLTQSYIYFSHPNQERTCHRCGSCYHHGLDCPISKTTAPSKRDNVMNLDPDEFPELSNPHAARFLQEKKSKTVVIASYADAVKDFTIDTPEFIQVKDLTFEHKASMEVVSVIEHGVINPKCPQVNQNTTKLDANRKNLNNKSNLHVQDVIKNNGPIGVQSVARVSDPNVIFNKEKSTNTLPETTEKNHNHRPNELVQNMMKTNDTHDSTQDESVSPDSHTIVSTIQNDTHSPMPSPVAAHTRVSFTGGPQVPTSISKSK